MCYLALIDNMYAVHGWSVLLTVVIAEKFVY